MILSASAELSAIAISFVKIMNFMEGDTCTSPAKHECTTGCNGLTKS